VPCRIDDPDSARVLAVLKVYDRSGSLVAQPWSGKLRCAVSLSPLVAFSEWSRRSRQVGKGEPSVEE